MKDNETDTNNTEQHSQRKRIKDREFGTRCRSTGKGVDRLQTRGRNYNVWG